MDEDEAAIGEVGRAVRRLRKHFGFTLMELASRTGLSHSFISQLERGVTRPSILSLHKLARALDTSAQELLSLGAEGSVSLVRSGEGTILRDESGVTRALVHGRREMQPLEFTDVQRTFGEYYAHPASEFLYVVEGTVEIDLDGKRLHTLDAGDTIYYEGGVPHRWRNAGTGGVKVLLVQHNAGGPPA